MSLFPPEELSYLRLVEQAFVQLKGSGLMLSPLDVEIVRRWELEGAPARVVCRAIRESFEAHARTHGAGVEGPRSLRYCAPAVDDALKAWRKGRLEGGAVPDGM